MARQRYRSGIREISSIVHLDGIDRSLLNPILFEGNSFTLSVFDIAQNTVFRGDREKMIQISGICIVDFFFCPLCFKSIIPFVGFVSVLLFTAVFIDG